jgi:hypothetical protein
VPLVRDRRTFAVLVFVAAAAAGSAAFQSQLVLQKGDSREYHRPWCPVVRDGKEVVALPRAQAESRGLKPHAACDKDPAAGADKPGDAGSAPVFVHIDGSKYYHREKCAKASGPLTRTPLATAGKSRWPCPACRPPVRKVGA